MFCYNDKVQYHKSDKESDYYKIIVDLKKIKENTIYHIYEVLKNDAGIVLAEHENTLFPSIHV